ncbi:MAG: hydrolase TatD [Bdellovibrionales bacterium GWA2_49_15]|nr:MAG: hydrolase TatD [Bdellovibrionales bacterium GWA2_49_15]HAZ11861.1 TatD family deoxyribonuclease [Bdellovibrionales bacterium]
MDKSSWQLHSPIVETHFHLDYLKQADPKDIMTFAQSLGITKAITISVSASNIAEVLPLALNNEGLFTTQGIHPHHAIEWNEQLEEIMKQNATHPKVVAIGEIGLDYFYNHSPPDVQKKVFRRQLELSIEFDLPIIVHSREADSDTINILSEYMPDLTRKGVIHSFTSERPLLDFALEQEFYVGFNGIITFKSAQNVRESLAVTPIERIVLETDAPFLTPMPFRGRENAPFYLPFIADSMAQQKKIEARTLLSQIYQNTHQLFYKI